jgi:protein HIRA/HIR1
MLVDKLAWVSHSGEHSHRSCAFANRMHCGNIYTSLQDNLRKFYFGSVRGVAVVIEGILCRAGTSILSIDVQVTGPRFATAGLDQKVKIWNLPAALNAKQEADSSVPPLLATLTDHFGPVNVARFARKADLLASGSDDKIVCIYELRDGRGQRSFGSSEGPSLENWKILHSLRGHSNNITDIAWSNDDTLVASCSLDNTIIVWNVKTGQKVQTLEGHKSYVKGLAWDPIGKYLASEADDRSIIIWRTSDWSVGQVITRPFVAPNSFVSNTFSLRLDWSPDGACLAAVNSFQSPKHTAPMIDRQSWDFQFSMVGHNGAVLCAKHSPKLYYQPGEGGRPPKLATCVALGSQDRRITVWLTTSTRPFCILNKVFKQGPVDLAWVPDGRSFLACSPDGTIALFQFTEEELGKVAPQVRLGAHVSTRSLAVHIGRDVPVLGCVERDPRWLFIGGVDLR